MSIETISSQGLLDRLSQHPLCVLDVRTAAEVKQHFFPGAITIPLDELNQETFIEAANKSGYQANPIYLLCHSGQRAKLAAQKLSALAGLRLIIVEGGMKAIADLANNESSPNHGINLDRQVRMIIGLSLIVSVMLGLLIHPIFFTLTALMGAGMFYAGYSNACALALLLAKAPWNKHKS
jgi:rhodanese-related sulfurtransferase